VNVSDLIVISYPDEATGQQAYEEAQRLGGDLIVEFDALGLVTRDADGKTKVETPSGGSAGKGAVWGVLFGTLFGMLLFIPVIGLVIGGAFGAIFGALDKSGIDKAFRERLKEQLQPGTSALVMVVEKVTPDKAIESMSKYGGTVLQTSLSADAEKQLQEALHGSES
jgi:uncharacterized membrane protein